MFGFCREYSRLESFELSSIFDGWRYSILYWTFILIFPLMQNINRKKTALCLRIRRTNLDGILKMNNFGKRIDGI